MIRPILSISILCSGREETEKCLKSLQTLRERVSTELILVDTGCDERMRSLLKGYADKILSYAWTGDFSAARNVGLREAKGEWFLFIDDDEWFMDTDAIEQFFLSGEYKNYGYANYIVRNYTDIEGTDYEDLWVTRLISLKDKPEFQGIVHEHFEPIYRPYKMLPSIAEHYGYAYRTPEEAKKHSKRNRELLKKAMEDEPDNLRNWMHLAQEYAASEEYAELEKFCQEALQKLAEKNDMDTNRDRGCFYCELVDAEVKQKKYKEAELSFEQAISDKRNTEYCIARLSVSGAEIYDSLGKDGRTAECCSRYFKLWDKYADKPDELFSQEAVLVNTAFHSALISLMYSYRICADLNGKSTAYLKEDFDRMGWEKPQVYLAERFMPCLVTAMAELPYEEIFSHAAETILNRPGAEIFLDEIKKINEEPELARLFRIFSDASIPSLDNFMHITDYCMKDASPERVRNLKRLAEKSSRDSVRREYFLIKLSEAEVISIGQESKVEPHREIRNLLEHYVEACLHFYGIFFQERAFQGEMEFLPKSGQAAVKLRDMLKAETEDDWAAFSSELKEAVGILPELGGTLKAYARLYAEERAAGKNAHRTGTDGSPAEAGWKRKQGNMRKEQKQEIEGSLKLLSEAHKEIQKAVRQKKYSAAQNMLSECQELAISMGNTIESLEGKGHKTVELLEEYCETLFSVYEAVKDGRADEKQIREIFRRQQSIIAHSIQNDIIVRKEVVFLPYNASMWDCMESAWKAAMQDESKDVYVIPIPYFVRNPDGSFGQMHYEGDQYPAYVPITDWRAYSIPKRKPDEIYIHNPYDDCNFVTSVHPAFYSKELKKYTDMLIYIPYFIGINDRVDEHFCTMPGVLFADRVIVESENIKKIYVDALREFETKNRCKGVFGNFEEKITVQASSKLEKVAQVSREDVEIPEEWENILYDGNGTRRKVIFYNTTIAGLLKYNDAYLDKLENVLRIFHEEGGIALLWRPHPLLKATLKSMRPELYARYLRIEERFKEDNWGIYDESADVERAIALSDAYYGDWSSVVEMYKVTEKPIMIQNVEIRE